MCKFCGSKRIPKVFVTSVGKTFLCKECGAIENRGEVDQYVYDHTYFVKCYSSIESQQFDCFTDILNSIEDYVRLRKLLDVGCGSGILLKAAYSLGYRNSVGVDSSASALDIARKNVNGTDVAVKSNFGEILERFGVISLMDSIAHIDNIGCCLSSLISNNLEKNGLVVIKTPLYSKTYFYYGLILGWLLGLIGKQEFVSKQIFFMPTRLFLFTEKSLDIFMAKLGLIKISSSVQSEYVREKTKIIGVKNRVTNFLFGILPDLIRGQKQTIIYVARK